jgi:peptidoglycan/xylan/chitin deacetylase (PgdA/CDA1 family)
MENIKKLFKLITLLVCYGISYLLRKEQSLAIIMYHSFDEEGWRYGVSPENLKKQLSYLKEKKNIVSLEQVVQYARDEICLKSDSVAITIDDGYEDTFTTFFPLAQKYNIPFTLFLTTDLTKKPNLGNLNRPTRAQLQQMHDSGLVSFGLHGHSHMHFTEVFDKDLIEEEILKSEDFLESITGEKPKFVAYPSGRYNEQVLNYFKTRSEYVAGLAIHSGFVSPRDDLFRLKRVEVSRNIQSFLLFKLRLTPALTVYNSIINRFRYLP